MADITSNLSKKIRLPGRLSTRMGLTLALVISSIVVTACALSILASVNKQGQNYLTLSRNLLIASEPAVKRALQKKNVRAAQEYLGYLSLEPKLARIDARLGNKTLFSYRGDPSEPNWIVSTLIPEVALNAKQSVTFKVSDQQTATLAFTYSPELLNSAVNNIILEALLIGLATLIAMLTLMMLVLKHYTAPLKPLTQLAERLSRGEWDENTQPRKANSREFREINDALSRGSNTIRHYVESLENTREELGQSERRLRSLINGMREILFEVDKDGFITFLNPAWKTITGFTIDSSLGQPFTRYLADASDHEMFAPGKIETLEQKNRELRLTTSEHESIVWVTLEASAQTDDAGNLRAS